eukprot:scaffold12342_cov181-Isochrysis_galbana.AAC.1
MPTRSSMGDPPMSTQAEDGQHGVGVLATPEVDQRGKHGLRQEGDSAQHVGRGHLQHAHEKHRPEEVRRPPLEPADLELLGVAHQEEDRHDKREAERAEEDEIGQQPPQLQATKHCAKVEEEKQRRDELQLHAERRAERGGHVAACDPW